jgi:nicotinamide-nucleotide amidase
MRAEIVCVGTELLLGNIVNTNAAAIARDLAVWGVDVYHHSTVGDNIARCAETLRTALGRAEAVVVTGGIGPTPDDCTRDALALVLGVELIRPPELLAGLEARYATWNRKPSGSSFKQIELPAGTQAIPNPTGSAVGILAAPREGPYAGRAVYVMPGVPSEMTRMLAESVLPDLRTRFGIDSALFARVLRTRNVGESVLADELHDLLTECTNPTVATYVKTGEVEVRLTCRARSRAEAEALFAPLEADIRARLGAAVFGADDQGLEERLGELLRARGATLATAESCTGGLVGERVTSVPGSSSYYLGGVVAYDNRVKENLLEVSAEVLAHSGAVSGECAAAMARGVGRRLGASLALATTGIAGPDGGTADKPVGLVYIALWEADGDQVIVDERRFTGERAQIKERTALAALELACRHWTGSVQ